MTRRELAALRAAILAGVNAAFDVLDGEVRARVITRAPHDPANEDGAPVDETARARAKVIAAKGGVGR